LGWHVTQLERVLTTAARGALPVWRTTPIPILFVESGLPSAEAALEEAKLRFAKRLQTVDAEHPLVQRIKPPVIQRGPGAGSRAVPKTKIQRLGALLLEVPRPKLISPRFTPGCRLDPTGGLDKETAATRFKEWWAALPPNEVTIFSDGSEKWVEGQKYVGFGYAIFQNGKAIAQGCDAIDNRSHVFDAEAVGAWRALEHAIALPPEVSQQRLHMCIDSTSVIWGVRADAPPTSQWAFLNIHSVMDAYNVQARWSPGHMDIDGNELADKLANKGAMKAAPTEGNSSLPTISGLGTVVRDLREKARQEWWTKQRPRLSKWYREWLPEYKVKDLPQLHLRRPVLQRLLAIRTSHGDFEWYHRRYKHEDAELHCSCGAGKAPLHIFRCEKTQRRFHRWPDRPDLPPESRSEAHQYMQLLFARPAGFAKFLELTKFYSTICTR
jgi:ribonuclease HI